MEIEKIVSDMPKSSNLRFAFKILISHIKHYYQTHVKFMYTIYMYEADQLWNFVNIVLMT